MYKNTTYFCILILYPATSLKSLIISNSLLVESLGFYITLLNIGFYIITCHLQTENLVAFRKETIQKMQRKPTKWEKIFANIHTVRG